MEKLEGDLKWQKEGRNSDNSLKKPPTSEAAKTSFTEVLVDNQISNNQSTSPIQTVDVDKRRKEKASYKDALITGESTHLVNPLPLAINLDLEISASEKKEDFSKKLEDIPCLSLPEHYLTHWNQALIVKTTGKAYETIYLRNRLLELWKLKKTSDLLHIGMSFY